MMQRIVYLILMLFLIASLVACTARTQPPAQQAVPVAQLNQRISELEKRLKALEDTSPAMAKTVADFKKELAGIKLQLDLVETRPLPSGLSPQEKDLLDNLEKRIKALEPTPTPTRTPTTTPSPTPTPTPTSTPAPTPSPTPLASAAALSVLEKRVDTLEKLVKQLEGRPTVISTPTLTPTATPTPTPTPMADLRVVKHSGVLDEKRTKLTITGEVTNLGNATSGAITIVATLYKIDGTVLGSGTARPVISSLPPGERSPFRLEISNLDFTYYNYGYDLRATTATVSQ